MFHFVISSNYENKIRTDIPVCIQLMVAKRILRIFFVILNENYLLESAGREGTRCFRGNIAFINSFEERTGLILKFNKKIL